MNYHFDVEYAIKYGVNEAIMLQNFIFWIQRNMANDKHKHDGKTWTFNTRKAYQQLFPFWSERQVRNIIDSLIEQKVLITGNYNRVPYDRTLWYALVDETMATIPQNERMPLTPTPDATDENDEPIPYIKTHIENTNNAGFAGASFKTKLIQQLKWEDNLIEETAILDGASC
jgi:hypothetical protein